MTPKLSSRRLVLIPYEPELVKEEHVNWLNDKELMRFSEQRHFNHTLQSQFLYVRDPDPNRLLWLIRTVSYLGTADPDFVSRDIGTITAYIDPYNEHANLGVLIGRREFHGLGFGAEAWKTVMDFLLSNGMHKVEAGCREDNYAMRRVALTTGMEWEATIEGHFKKDGQFIGLCLYGRYKADLPVSQRRLDPTRELGNYAA